MAAPAYAWRVRSNVAHVAPIGNDQAPSVLVDEQGACVDRIDDEVLGGAVVSQGFEIVAAQALVVEDGEGGLVAFEGDELVIGGIEPWLAIGGLAELTADGEARRGSGEGHA